MGLLKSDDVLVGAIDQGTSSSRVLVFRVSDWKLVSVKRVEFESEYPQEGWCEQDPKLILSSVTKVSEFSSRIVVVSFLTFSLLNIVL